MDVSCLSMSSQSYRQNSLPFPCPERSRSMSPLSVPTNRLTPHRAPHRISPLNFLLYLRISGDCGGEEGTV